MTDLEEALFGETFAAGRGRIPEASKEKRIGPGSVQHTDFFTDPRASDGEKPIVADLHAYIKQTGVVS